jgi:hypothetical protein
MLRVEDVLKVDYERKRIRKEIYKRIYEQFTRKVKLSTEMGYKHTMLVVPSLVFGFPPFDRHLAGQFMARQFRNGGFEVHFVDDFTLYVCWNIKKQKKQNEPPPESEIEDVEFPTFVNLKKAVAKYRKSA